MGKIYSKQMESMNLHIFESVIFSQDANTGFFLLILIYFNMTIYMWCVL